MPKARGSRTRGGGPGRPQGLERGCYVRPTLFSDVQPQMRIAQEEIFGPVLVIIAYDSVDEAVAIANGTEYGLGAHVQGRDLAAARAVAARIRSGQVHINNPPWSPDAPFGGYKRSGNGRERTPGVEPRGIPRNQGHPRLHGRPGGPFRRMKAPT